MRHVILFANSL